MANRKQDNVNGIKMPGVILMCLNIDKFSSQRESQEKF